MLLEHDAAIETRPGHALTTDLNVTLILTI